MMKLILASVIAAGLTSPALAGQLSERTDVRQAMTAPPLPAGAAAGFEPVSVVIAQGGETLWSGTLKVGRAYGSASYSQSRNEADEPCAGAAKQANANPMTSSSLNFNIGRYNSPQEPDGFSVNLNWSRPIPACQGQGNDSYGINRNVTLARGQTIMIEGTGGVSIRLSRSR
jgi:hypothetical protein